MKKIILCLVGSLMVSCYCFAQDGSFNNLTLNQIVKGGGAGDFSGWGLNFDPLLDVRPNSTSHRAFAMNFHDGLTLSAHSAYGGIRFYNQGYPVGPLEPSMGAKMVMSINNNFVGIGIPSPRVPLDVGGDIADGKLGVVLGRLPEGDNEGEGTFLGVRGFNTTNDYGRKSFALEHSFYGIVNSSINFLRGVSKDGGLITFNTNTNLERMRIDAYGNVGIGTTDPMDYRLAVKGKIRAQEIKVETANWPDYVFAKDYKLPSLAETEKHIQQKGHLPGIPSATEVKANGIDLGDMNAKLLQKIEELTLHLIEQEKRASIQNQKLQNQISTQQLQIEQLEKRK